MGRRIGALLLVATVAAGGCTPKRVTPAGVVTAPAPPDDHRGSVQVAVGGGTSSSVPVPGRHEASAAPEAGADSPLPPPKPLARSGTSAFPRSATSSTAQTDPSVALGRRAVDLAKAQLGKPYQWGAAGPDRFDCSGLVQYVYSNLGVPLPRVSSQQAGAGVHVDRRDLAPGDLVFFHLSGSRIDHVGIYVGNGRFIHAPNRHTPVQIDSLHDSWWGRRFRGGRRVG